MTPSLIDFWTGEYLNGYIQAGGSKVKLITSKQCAQMSEFLRELERTAARSGYATAYLDARTIAKVNLLSSIYQAAVRELDIDSLVAEYCREVIRSLGYDPAEIPGDRTFIDWACEMRGREPVSLRREVKEYLENELFRQRNINRTFATAILQIAGGALGITKEGKLSPEDTALLYGWMRAEAVPLRELRRFHVFSRIDRYNARLMLRSLVEFARIGGKRGLFLAVDGLEVLLARKENGRPLYSKTAREEFYESARQLIDEIDALQHLMIVLAFGGELIDDRQAGLESYKALWLRIQKEVRGGRFNYFSDLVDLDADVFSRPVAAREEVS